MLHDGFILVNVAIFFDVTNFAGCRIGGNARIDAAWRTYSAILNFSDLIVRDCM
jgi:hypothetical protein